MIKYSKRTPKKYVLRKRARKALQKLYNPSKIGLRLQMHHFKYKVLTKNFLQIEFNGSDQFFSREFKLTDIVNQSELTALFDQYRINAVKVDIIPRQGASIHFQPAPFTSSTIANAGSTDNGGTNLFGSSNWGMIECITVLDYDDVTTPPNLNNLLEYNNMRRTLCPKEHKRYFKPTINVDTTNTSLIMRHKWLDCDKPNVPHYGLKGGFCSVPSITIPGTSDKPVMNVDLMVTYYISFKNTR